MDSGEVTDFTLNSIVQSRCSLSHEAPTVCMLTPLNQPKCPHDSIFFTADDRWIEFPQSGCPFPVCVWRVATAAGEFGATLPHSLNSHIAFSTGQVAAHFSTNEEIKNGVNFFQEMYKNQTFSHLVWRLNLWAFVCFLSQWVCYSFVCYPAEKNIQSGCGFQFFFVCSRVCLSLLFLVSHLDESLAAHKAVSGAL